MQLKRLPARRDVPAYTVEAAKTGILRRLLRPHRYTLAEEIKPGASARDFLRCLGRNALVMRDVDDLVGRYQIQLNQVDQWDIAVEVRVANAIFFNTDIRTKRQLHKAIAEGILLPSGYMGTEWEPMSGFGIRTFERCCEVCREDSIEVINKWKRVNEQLKTKSPELEKTDYLRQALDLFEENG